MASVLIFGARGLGSLVLDILRQGDEYEPLAYLDSDPGLRDTRVDGLPVLGGLEALDRARAIGVRHAVVAIGENRARCRVSAALTAAGMDVVSAIHPLASIAGSATVRGPVILGARAAVCVHARVEPHCVIQTGAIVEHDNTLETGAFLHVAARLAGGVTVGALARIGVGASVIPGRRVGAEAVVEAGAVVVRDVGAAVRVAGIPARVVAGPGVFRPSGPPVAPPGAGALRSEEHPVSAAGGSR